MPIKIFHHLEIIGFNRCLDLLELQKTMIPYYLKRKEHIETKAQRLQIVKNESVGTSRTNIDPKCPIAGLRWKINTRSCYCQCGKYVDRGFPCAHIAKTFQKINQTYEQLIHKCYFTSTIKNVLNDIHALVELSSLERDEALCITPDQVFVYLVLKDFKAINK